jgi:hypothetical protein
VLPLGFTAISDYAQRTSAGLRSLHMQCVDEGLPKQGIILLEFPEVPSDQIELFVEFIEYSDAVNIRLFEILLSQIQVQSARIREMVSDIKAEREDRSITERMIEEYILDTIL